MQIRFRIYNPKTKDYKLLGYTDVTDYDIAFKMLTYMKEHECEYPIELNTEDMVDTTGNLYRVENVSYCVPALGTELTSHIVVDLEEEY